MINGYWKGTLHHESLENLVPGENFAMDITYDVENNKLIATTTEEIKWPDLSSSKEIETQNYEAEGNYDPVSGEFSLSYKKMDVKLEGKLHEKTREIYGKRISSQEIAEEMAFKLLPCLEAEK